MEKGSDDQPIVASCQSSSFKTTRTSLRRSLEITDENNSTDILHKKPRRSLGRRKSLLEALQSVQSSPVEGALNNTNLLEAVSETRNAAKVVLDAVDKVSNAAASSELMELDDIPHTKFVLQYNNILKKELDDWKTLHEEYKIKERKAKTEHLVEHEFSSVSGQLSSLPENSQHTYEKYTARLTQFEQRFSVAVKTIKTSLKQINNLRRTQENWVNNRIEKEIQDLQQFSDSQILFKRICGYHSLISDNQSEKIDQT